MSDAAVLDSTPNEALPAHTPTPSEVLMLFIAWLTTRKVPVTFSEQHDASIGVQLFRQFVDANNLPDCTENFPKGLRHPVEVLSETEQVEYDHNQQIREAGRKLVLKLDEVFSSAEYMSVFSLHQNRGGRYTGPTVTAELNTLRDLVGLPTVDAG